MKKKGSRTHRTVTLMPPKSMRRPVASMHAPDLFENGKLRKHNVSIMDFMPGVKRPRKAAGVAR
jgi:hypothetical protein